MNIMTNQKMDLQILAIFQNRFLRCMLFLAVVPDDGKIVNHQPEFTEATIKPAAIEAIKNGSVLLASTVLELDSL